MLRARITTRGLCWCQLQALKLWLNWWTCCCIVCSVGVLMMGGASNWISRTRNVRFTACRPVQTLMRGGDLKIQVRFCVCSTQTLEERREWVSCPPDMGQNGENEILTMNQSELDPTPPEYLAELKDSSTAKPTPHHGEWRAMLLLLRDTFYCWGRDASELQV